MRIWDMRIFPSLKKRICQEPAVISTIRSTRIITDHVIYNPAYTYKFQLKPTLKVGIFQRKILPTMKRQMS